MDCSPPGSSVCGILPAEILEQVAISYARDCYEFVVDTVLLLKMLLLLLSHFSCV